MIYLFVSAQVKVLVVKRVRAILLTDHLILFAQTHNHVSISYFANILLNFPVL